MSDEQMKKRYSDKELNEFEELIDEKLENAREQLQYYKDQLLEMAESADSKIKALDDGVGTLETERVNQLAARQRKYIQHLENAKIRIHNKAYGVCRVTGELISKERLKAVPHATLSIKAKQQR